MEKIIGDPQHYLQYAFFEILHSKETFIEKPFSIEEIGRIVRQQLDKIE